MNKEISIVSTLGMGTILRWWVVFWLLLGGYGVAGAEDYLLGPGDFVKITVFDYPDLAVETRVSASGGITFPLVGEVLVGGKSPRQAETLLAQKLTEQGFIKQPHVNLVVTEFASQQVSVMGSVSKPGQYALERASTLSQVLAAAGGVSSEGGEVAVLVRTAGGGNQHREIDLRALFAGDVSKDIGMTGGDLVYVPKAQTFYIYGEVQHPGVFRLERDINIAQAISIGGGLTARGTDDGVEVKRRGGQGELLTETAELGDLVRPDDVIYVRESWF
ncbi:polysaccharide export outer membrane protein [Methylomagnum ishizawai]|uniref:Polysaccharide export outer membrane protein n=1 Tax=Methylomagnum ishizawai TaxID=1760988 RepID=A0A1Y6CST0_9GAMM|nr:polysaccharide export protein EpsE [Methylomagnum ishizawai]SMF93357.1 polysaccharide export outer membrane protein [Methylomagnum ishizawai]